MKIFMPLQDYLQRAQENEKIFRAVLRALKEKGSLGMPQEFNPEKPLEEIFRTYSTGERNGKFTILNFQRASSEKAIIAFENINYKERGGKGVELRYCVLSDHSVKIETELLEWELKF